LVVLVVLMVEVVLEVVGGGSVVVGISVVVSGSAVVLVLSPGTGPTMQALSASSARAWGRGFLGGPSGSVWVWRIVHA
jgi:hypothetical protein